MTKEEFYRFQRKTFSKRAKVFTNETRSETDPSFAMNGQQMFMAAMRGEPIPGTSVNYYYSGISPDQLTSVDRAYPDRCDVAIELSTQENQIKNDYQRLKNDEK